MGTTATFELGDWNPRYQTQTEPGATPIVSGAAPLSSAARVAPVAIAVDDSLVVTAEAAGLPTPQTSEVSLTVPAGQDYTLEATIFPVWGWPALRSGSRAFIGRITSGFRQGILLTSSGLALADRPEDPTPTLIAGTRSVLYTDEGELRPVVTLRLVFDSGSSTLSIYSAFEGDGYGESDDNISSYRVAQLALSPDPSVTISRASLKCIAEPGVTVGYLLSALRVSNSQRLPTLLPACSILGPVAGQVDEAPRFFAEASDPVGLPLSYEWDITQSPEDSDPRMGGGAHSFVDIGAEVDSNYIRVRTRKQRAAFNGWVIRLADPNRVDHRLTVEVQEDQRRVVFKLSTDSLGAITTTAADLLSAVTNPAALGYTSFLSDTFQVSSLVQDAPLSGVLPLGDYTLAGGGASVVDSPVLLARQPGVYVLTLRVFNGVVWSPTVAVTYLATKANLLRGAKPQTKYLFRYLPDFFSMVGNREVMSEAWSAAAQVVASDLFAAWQSDASRYIQEISPIRQRRHVAFTFAQELEGEYALVGDEEFRASSAPRVPLFRSPFNAETSQETVPFREIEFGAVPAWVQDGMSVLLETDMYSPQSVRVVKISGNRVAVSPFLASRELRRGYAGRFVEDGVSPSGTSLWFTDPAFTATAEPGVYLIRIGNGQLTEVFVREDGTIVFPVAQPITGARQHWQLLRVTGTVGVRKTPYLNGSIDAVPGDSLKVSYWIDQDTLGEAFLPVVAVGYEATYVDWAPLKALMQTTALASVTAWQNYYQVISLHKRTNHFEQYQYLRGVPTLGSEPSDQTLRQGEHYTVSPRGLALSPLLYGYASSESTGRDYFTLVEPRYSPGNSPENLAEALVGRYIYFSGGVGGARVRSVEWPKVVLDRPIRFAGRTDILVPRYRFDSPPPDTLWAEQVVLDGSKVIEGSFGALVGLPLDKYDPAAPAEQYLSSVRAVHYALMTGPTLSNVAMALETLLGAKVAMETGTVTNLLAPNDLRDGFVTVVLEDGTIQVSPYNREASPAINPDTGRTFKASVPGLPEDLQGDDHLDSQVPPFTPVLSTARVDDYLTDPSAVDAALGEDHRVQRFHTFLVRVPLSAMKWDGVVECLRSVLDDTKPTHTDYILYGTMTRSQDIDIQDDLDIVLGLRLQDSINPPLFAIDPANYLGVLPVAYANYEGLWPEDETLGRGAGPAGAWNTDDVLEKYESSYVVGVLDDYSGDGSLNSRQRQMHFVNMLDSDWDVPRCRLMVPILKDTVTAGQDEQEFAEGELVELQNASGLTVGWASARPEVAYVGSPPHPQIPFNVFSPQNEHPNTYLLLKFTTDAANNYDEGNEGRLDAIKTASDAGASPVYIVGVTSGARAEVVTVPDLSNTAHHGKYFFLRRVFSQDLLKDVVPYDAVSLRQSFYTPFGGTLLSDVEALGPQFDPMDARWRGFQIQQEVYDTTKPDNEQFLPSFDPGLYTDFDLSAATQDTGPGPAAKNNVYWRWGYTDVGGLGVTPTNLNAFTLPGSDYVQNLWAGVIEGASVDFHWTHGFKRAAPHPPVPELVTINGTTLRIEGWYFIEPDTTATNPPDASDPSLYDGTYPGSWAYLYDGSTFYPLTGVTFETGTAGGRTVLGVDGAVQTSTGHVLEGTLPVGLPDGTYDIAVIHFYPWRMHATAPLQIRAEFGYLDDAYVVGGGVGVLVPGGFGTGIFGIDPFGV